MLQSQTRAHRQGFRDAKEYAARNHYTLNGYGRARPLTPAERIDYAAGYEAGEKARTAADYIRWQLWTAD